MSEKVKHWIHGLVGGVIGGAETAGSSWLAMAGAQAAGIDVPLLNWKALGVILVVGAVSNTLAYLKQSPLPPEDDAVAEIKKFGAGPTPPTVPLILLLCALAFGSMTIFTGCATTPQTKEAVKYFTFADTWTAAHSAYQAHCENVVNGKVSRANEVKVDAAWNRFRFVFKTALNAAQKDWSAPTPAMLDTAEQELINLIRNL